MNKQTVNFLNFLKYTLQYLKSSSIGLEIEDTYLEITYESDNIHIVKMPLDKNTSNAIELTGEDLDNFIATNNWIEHNEPIWL